MKEQPRSDSLHAAASFQMGVVDAIDEAGIISVRMADASTQRCLLLHTGAPLVLAAGDPVLIAPLPTPTMACQYVVMGRVGPWRAPTPPQRLTIEATEVLSLKCGEVSIDLRASDGKLMLRGEDVLLRARGTQRIKAGSVNIN